jgi:hypothetical protein
MNRVALLAALCLGLAACEDPSAAPAEQGAAATGEVLAGSISDAMIPLDELNSQAPLAPRQAIPTGDVDAEQPEVDPVPGIEGAPAEPPAAPPPAAPVG